MRYRQYHSVSPHLLLCGTHQCWVGSSSLVALRQFVSELVRDNSRARQHMHMSGNAQALLALPTTY